MYKFTTFSFFPNAKRHALAREKAPPSMSPDLPTILFPPLSFPPPLYDLLPSHSLHKYLLCVSPISWNVHTYMFFKSIQGQSCSKHCALRAQLWFKSQPGGLEIHAGRVYGQDPDKVEKWKKRTVVEPYPIEGVLSLSLSGKDKLPLAITYIYLKNISMSRPASGNVGSGTRFTHG